MSIRNKTQHIFLATIGLTLLLASPVLAYSTRQNNYSSNGSYYSTVYNTNQNMFSNSSSNSNSNYYSTIYGWVSGSSSQQPAPQPTPQPTPQPAPQPTPQPAPQPTPAPTPTPSPAGMTAEEMQMVNLVNQERAKAGVAPLAAESNLAQIARTKSQDMVDSNYFGHTSPNFGSTFNLINAKGFVYTTGGENLAGASDVNTAHQMLMNSPGHRANILNPAFNRIGVGIVHGGPYGAMFTELFLG